MADNVSITPGAGATVAADEVTDAVLGAGVKVQFVKLMDGTLDGTAKAAVGARGLAVDLGSQIASDASGNLKVSVTSTSAASVDGALPVKEQLPNEVLPQILVELKLISQLLNDSLLSHMSYDLSALRAGIAAEADPAIITTN